MRGLIVCLCAFLWALDASAGPPAAVAADTAVWRSPPGMSGLSAAWLIGTENASGAYALRVRLAPHTQIPAHSHPDERITTVLSGTLYVLFGPPFDMGRTISVPAGSVYRAPAGVQHKVWSNDAAVEYQENGLGPTANTFATPAQDP